MKVNDVVFGFKLIQKKDVSDIASKMYVFEHVKSGANLVYLENDDTNKCFSAGFRTLPEDSTGICHIIEHSLLCGSKKYPTKEPFVNLLKGSMATFLNAMTAYDWTIYPVASQNDKDFSNLMSVYLDAVFAPLSVLDEKPFLQEGWHLEMNSVDELPQYKGVVYNEMKGAMSSVEEQLSQKTLESLYKGTCYEYNSGGDPEAIVNLTYDYYKEFYHRHYHPDNCLLYLYGKMDINEKLKFIDEEYLSNFEKGNNPIIIKRAAKVVNTEISSEYEISESEEEKDNTYMSLAFALDTYDNALDLIGFGILNEALMSTNDSPLKKALLALNMGQDVASSIDDDNIFPSFQVFLHKTNVEYKEKFLNYFIAECKKLVKDGIDKNLLLATINNNEFRSKEMDSGRSPKGLFFAFNLMQSFNYHVPYENYLEYSRYYDYYRKELNNGYFERLLEKYIINSDHYVEVVLKPNKELGAKKALEMKNKMQSIYDKMTLEEKEECVKKTKELIAYQSKKDTLDELATLPKLALSDINSNVNTLPTKEVSDGNHRFIEHNFSTNGIGYLKLFFDLSVLEYDELPYALILSNLFKELDTKDMKAQEILSYIKTYLGQLSFSLLFGGASKEACTIKFAITASALEENINKIPYVLNEIINNSVLDYSKINTILLQMKMNYRSTIIEDGMDVVSTMARSSSSKEGSITFKLGAYNMYYFIDEILEEDASQLISKLKDVADRIFNINNLVASVSGNDSVISKLKNVTKDIKLHTNDISIALHIGLNSRESKALVIPSGVNYNGKAINLKDLGYENTGALKVIRHILNYDYLWPEVRVKGGAYGCRINVLSCGDIVLSSFRDPNVKNTFDVYNNVYAYLENLDLTEDEFNTYLIGAIGGFDQPASNSARIATADSYYFMGITDDMRKSMKEEMIKTTLAEVKSYAKLFKELAQMASSFTIGNEAKIKEFNDYDKIEVL